MNKILTTMIAATILSVPFSISAAELDNNVSLGDMYSNEGTSSYDIAFSKSPVKSVDVSLGDMYSNEGGNSYDTELSNSPVTSVDVTLEDMYAHEGTSSYDITFSNSI
mgnify:FL=1